MSQSLPVRLTYIAATLFMVIAVVMSLIAGRVGQGQAPELVDDAGVAAAGQVSSGLDAYGIGTNNVDAERLEATEDTGVPAAAMEDEEPATGIADEGAELKPAASNEESETISETTLEEAVGAAEALVESVGEAVNEAAETVEDAVETPTITQ